MMIQTGQETKEEKTNRRIVMTRHEDDEDGKGNDEKVTEEFDPFDIRYSLKNVDVPPLNYKHTKSWSQAYGIQDNSEVKVSDERLESAPPFAQPQRKKGARHIHVTCT